MGTGLLDPRWCGCNCGGDAAPHPNEEEEGWWAADRGAGAEDRTGTEDGADGGSHRVGWSEDEVGPEGPPEGPEPPGPRGGITLVMSEKERKTRFDLGI